MKGNKWTRGLRRGAACFMATVAMWVLFLTTDISGAAEAVKALGENSDFVEAVLSTELDYIPPRDEPGLLGRWSRLAVSQSSLLLAGEEAVLREEERSKEEPKEADDPQDPVQLPVVTTAPDDIQSRTLTHQEGNLAADDISINNTTGRSIDVAALAAAKVELALGDGPQILIMHTHGSEAYTMDGTDIYEPSDTYRTIDNNFNVVRIGSEIEAVLAGMGFSVVHDKSLYDYPAYSGAYDRSKEAVERYLAEYPTIKVVLDIHRDALIGADNTTYKTRAVVEEKEMAQIMLVVGSDDAGLSHPEWKKNLTLAVKLQQRMNGLDPTLARPITVRTNRFNQQLTTGSLLVEVGSHGNTLQEALGAAKLFARVLGEQLETLRK